MLRRIAGHAVCEGGFGAQPSTFSRLTAID
jgi:hypothetical protein